MAGNITIFQNIIDTSTPFYLPIEKILERVKDGKKSGELVKSIRKEKDPSKRNELKKKLPAICFSGEFTKRADNSISEHSGIICLDFDKFSSTARMSAVREGIEADRYVYSVFTSPSGNGLKVLVKIPPIIENHKLYFNALKDWFNLDEFDVSCKNISRVCYESYDPKVHINHESEVWEELAEEEYVEVEKRDIPATIAVTEEDEIIRRLLVWWEKEFGLAEGHKNDNLFILASSMNKFGIPRSTCSYALREYDQGKESIRKEIEQIIKSAYKATAEFDTKAFEDADKMHALERKLRQGETKSEVQSVIVDEYDIDEKQAKAIVNKLDEKAQEDVQVFWSKTNKGVVSIQHDRFAEFLQDNGFYKFYPEGSKNFIFVRKVSNRVKNITDQSIKDFVLGYIRQRIEDRSIWNFFADRTRFFKEDFLSMLDSIEIQFMEDTVDTSYLFFRNVALRITKKKVEQIEYENLPGWIWEDQTIDRDYKECDGSLCEFKQFIKNISGGEPKRISSMESTIGYLLHAYNPPSDCPAVILNDEIISENPEGGTGKGICATAIGQLRKSVVIDGKSFSFDKSFPYQLVQQDTQILVFDDVKKGFPFENLFSAITEGITLEKKNKDAIKIPRAKSPKILITTNYVLRGTGSSHDRRKWELEFKQHYKRGATPLEEFGHNLFTDWSVDEWCIFDNYMIGCLQLNLDQGLIKSPFKNLGARKFISSTNHEFHEFMNDENNRKYRTVGTKHVGADAYNDFVDQYPDYGRYGRNKLSQKFFYQYMMKFGTFEYGGESEKGRGATGVWVQYNEKEKEKEKELF